MRKAFLMLGLLSMAALASCSIEDELQTEVQSRKVRATLEQTVPEASTRAFAEYNTEKNKYYISWNEEDRISVFAETTLNQEYVFDGFDGSPSGTFSPAETAGSSGGDAITTDYQYAIYPYDKDTNLCDANGVLTLMLPAQQSVHDGFTPGIGARLLMVGRAVDGNFSFKHIGSYIGVTLTGNGVRVASISFQGNNAETLAGKATISFDNSGEPNMSFVSGDPGNSDVITMEFSTPVVLSSEETEFWLIVPSITLSKGYTITVTDDKGGTFQKVTENSVTLKRKTFYHSPAEVDITPAPLDESSYAKASTITVGGTYLVVNVADNLAFKGNADGSGASVSPVDGVITDTDGTLAAYEFTVENNGNNYYLKFNDGKYLICDYSNIGNTTTGIRYVNSQTDVRYPYTLTVSGGAFFFNTTREDNGSANQYLYYKTASGSGSNTFKIGGSGGDIGVHLYMKGGKQDRGLKFDPEEVICLEGSTPEKPVLSGTYTTVNYSSGNTSVATVDGSGNVTVVGVGTTTITAEAEEDPRYQAGSASYTLTVLDSSTATYAKASTITVGGTYLVVNVADNLAFKGNADGSGQSVSPENGVIIDYDRTLSAYEFTVENNGNNYYLKFNDGKYLICDYSNSGNTTTGIRYVNSQTDVRYPYTLTVSGGAFFFNTTREDNGSANQYLYYKTASGSGSNTFKIGGSGGDIGVHLYMKGGKQDRGLKFDPEEVICLEGSTPEKPVLSGTYTDVDYSSSNTSVATVDGNGNVTTVGVGTTTITAEVDADDTYMAASASYTLTVLDPSSSSYTKVSSITVGGTYLVVDIADKLVFTGAVAGSSVSVTPKNDVIVDTDNSLSAYEFTVEKSGDNYYLKFNDGKYLICDYSNSGNTTTGIRYVNSQTDVRYPYTLTVSGGAFFFNTTREDNGSANQYLYYKTASGSGSNTFKIGGSGGDIGVHLYLKGGDV